MLNTENVFGKAQDEKKKVILDFLRFEGFVSTEVLSLYQHPSMSPLNMMELECMAIFNINA